MKSIFKILNEGTFLQYVATDDTDLLLSTEYSSIQRYRPIFSYISLITFTEKICPSYLSYILLS